ncbi:MAG: hypothetical protein A2Y15_05295 [Clostridiales bacterium GWF2_36_10]|nr:MAG: hypothetical protein A2Y15_05295 [Clostridiales bacterium GWF2_36_10]HAN20079.1 hypothetical protein [Clostridiales bacterium]
MHDTLLNQNIYENIVHICLEHKINKIKNLIITVHTDSHICEESLREQFKVNNNILIDEWTNILIQKNDIEKLTAILDYIDGEK